MANQRNNFSPETMVDSGRRTFENRLRNSRVKNKEIENNVSAIITAQNEIAETEKYTLRLKEEIGKASGRERANLVAYLKSIEVESKERDKAIKAAELEFNRTHETSIKTIRENAEIEKARADRLADLTEKEKALLNKKTFTKDDEAELDAIRKARQKEQPRTEEGYTASVKAVIDSLGGNKSGLGSLLSTFGTNEKVEKGIEKVSDKLGGVDRLVKVTETIQGILGTIKQQMSKSISEAANVLKDYYGVINANLESSGETFDTISSQADDLLSTNRLVKQTDYLSQIATLSNEGLVDNIETRAILETIKNKTLTTFSSMDAGLLRLIRLQTQANTASQFGMEIQLKRVLNSVFRDSNYLSSMFDQVTSAITDAGVSTQSDITQFNSTVQTWLGAMYESGLSSNLISQIAQGINSLGSGNVSALASDENTQRLFLLAMDRINMDYADILQQGLSSSDTNKLMQSIVEYLNEIATNTKDNLVLRSSYSNLFNMSVSDLKAIQNLSTKMGDISNKFVDTSSAIQHTQNALANTVAANTTASEQFNNLFDNISYTFGSAIADSKGWYTTYRVSEIMYNLLDPLSNVGGKLGKLAGVLKMVPAATQYVVGVKGLIDVISNGFDSFSNESLVGFLSSASSNTGSGDSATEKIKSIGLKKQWLGENGLISSITGDTSEWEDEGESTLAVLKELSKTLMKLKDSENSYAFAVSIEGMNDNVLRSFASIFADEEAMMATFTGDNTVLQQALFDYLNDTTSNATSTSAQ